MILSYQTLVKRHAELIPMECDRDESLINPASIDIRVGHTCILNGSEISLFGHTEKTPLLIRRNDFVLVSTLEILAVPIDLAMELKLKSSRAREGWNHSLAFWFDPGWYGIGTMELTVLVPALAIFSGMKMAQLIYHKLDEPCLKPYVGKYHKATTVESAK